MDKLLEDAEVNFHMICDMVRYQNMKEAGMVHSCLLYTSRCV